MRSTFLLQLAGGWCLGMMLAGCGGNGPADDASGGTTPDSVNSSASGNKVLALNGKLFSIPSPVETALLIKRSGAAYDKARALALEASDKLSGRLQLGLVMGMFGADLAYVTTHKDGARALATLQEVEKVGGALDMSNAFDRALIDRYRNNVSNEDSLLRLSGDAFQAADRYLKSNDRNDVSALILAGGWIESMHLVLGENTLNDQLATRVGEQKRTIRSLIALVESSDRDSLAGKLLSGLKACRDVLDGVHSSYQFEAPVTDVGTRTTTITSRTSVTITSEQVAALRERIAALRALITS